MYTEVVKTMFTTLAIELGQIARKGVVTNGVLILLEFTLCGADILSPAAFSPPRLHIFRAFRFGLPADHDLRGKSAAAEDIRTL